jgi:hypothetical protein
LPSRGYSGRNIWLHLTGEYPHQVFKLKTTDGKDWGEWRGGGGCQTVIFGQHPNGTPDQIIRYSCVSKKPTMQAGFDDIAWPDNLVLPWLKAKPEPPPEVKGRSAITPDVHSRILAYLAAIPGAISGNGGDEQTYKVACELVNGWALTAEQAMPYLQAYSAKCEPPWKDKELEHKLAEAVKAPHEKRRGHLIGTTYSFKKSDAAKKPGAAPEVNLTGPNNDCPYPAIDWSTVSKQNRGHFGFHHRAIYPEDSILQPFMEMSRLVCEGADCYLLGSILPVIAAELERRVWMPWAEQRNLYTNLYSLLAGKPGDRKTSAINIPERIAFECLPPEAFLPYSFSPESLFDEYCRRPDKLLIIGDANPILEDWKRSGNGARTAAQFLRLKDCKRLAESYMRNKSETTSADRVVPETSTSVLFGATLNAAAFQGQQIRGGLARRFLYYIADKHGRMITNPPKVDLHGLANLFKSLLTVSGEVGFDSEAMPVWENFQNENRERYAATTYCEEDLAARISTEPEHVAKVAMIFEACRGIHYERELKVVTVDSLRRAIEHVAESLRSAAFLETIANRAVTAERANIVIAAIRRKFRVVRSGTIYATKSELTYEICHQGSRQGSIRSEELYNQIIPQLEAQGLARLAFKRGKLEVFAFQTEDFQDDSDLISPNSSNSSPSYMD